MEIGSIAATTTPAPPQPDTTMGNDVFMTLLVAQLKAQNPLEPLDPSQFVSQLVEFNTLDQLIQIREAVEAEPISALTKPTDEGSDPGAVLPELAANPISNPVNSAGAQLDAAPAISQ